MSQLYKAYRNLNFSTQNADGSRSIAIKRIRTLEVRILEFASNKEANGMEVWLELYRHDTKSSIDSYLCYDLDEAEPVLELPHFLHARPCVRIIAPPLAEVSAGVLGGVGAFRGFSGCKEPSVVTSAVPNHPQ